MPEQPASPHSDPTDRAPGPPRRPTIYDVAHDAQVTASTVSRAFSRPERVAVQTRQRVLEVADRLGYHPKRRSSATRGSARTLALIVPDITNPFFFELIQGAERQASAAGDDLLLASSGTSPDAEDEHVRRLIHRAHGLVLASSRLSDERLRQLIDLNPTVTVNRTVRGIPSVVIDDDQAMRHAAEHLASLGHRSVAYLAGPNVSWSNRVRWRGLSSACQRLGLEVVRLGPFVSTAEGGAAAADAALVANVSAVVAFNSRLAIGVQQRLHDRGIPIPGALSVIGADEIFGTEHCSPKLTTLAANIQEAGRCAIDQLTTILTTSHPVRNITLPSALLVRGSTGPAP